MSVLSIIMCYEQNKKLSIWHIFYKILNFLQLQILLNYHLVIYISWIELTNTEIKLHKS